MNYEESWNDYKGSPEWYQLKDKALKRAGYKCEGSVFPHKIGCDCPDTEYLEMHHEIYPEFPYHLNDKLENVKIYCKQHHTDEHFEELDRSAYVDEDYT